MNHGTKDGADQQMTALAAIPSQDAETASWLLPRLLQQTMLCLRSAEWNVTLPARDVAVVADALHNLPAFGTPEGSSEFDHHRFLIVEAADVLQPLADPDRAHGMRVDVAFSWWGLLKRAYGPEALESLFPRIAAAVAARALPKAA